MIIGNVVWCKLVSDFCISLCLIFRLINRKNIVISVLFIYNSMFLLILSELIWSWIGVFRKLWYYLLVVLLLVIIIVRIVVMIRIMFFEVLLLKNWCRCFIFYFFFRWIDCFYYFILYELLLKLDYSVGIICFLRVIEEFVLLVVRCVFDGCKCLWVILSLDNYSLRWGFLRD